MNTKKRNLFIFAGLLWLFAGIMVMNVGIPFLINDDKMFIFGFLGAIAIFLIFYIMIFSKYVHKHKNRILNDKREQMKIWEFFDKSSYILMFFMMTFGIALRFSGVSFLILAFKYYNF